MRRSLGWDLGAGEARWVEVVEEHGRPKVRAFGTLEHGGSLSGPPVEADGAATELLRGLVAQRRWRGREVVMALPRTAVTLTWMTLPAASRDDLGGMVELEAAQTLPFSVEEAAWDFAPSPAVDGSQPVLLVAARRQLVEERRRMVEAAGLRLGALTVDAMATAALLGPVNDAGATPEAGVMVRLEADSATLSYLFGGRVLVSRTASLAAPLASPAPLVVTLAAEVRRTLVAGTAASGGAAAPEVYPVWLTGHGADAQLAADLDAAMRQAGGAPVHTMLLPRDAIDGTEELPSALDLALGLALLGLQGAGSASFSGVDLTRRVSRAADAAAQRPKRSMPWVLGVGAAALAAGLLVWLWPSAQDRQLATNATRAQIEATQIATRRTQTEGRVRQLADAIAPRHSYLDVLNEVSALADAQVWLTQFTYDRGRPVMIRGAARTSSAITKMVDGLRASPHLENVTLGAMTESEVNKVPIVQFTIEGNLIGDTALQPAKRRAPTRATSTRKEPA